MSFSATRPVLQQEVLRLVSVDGAGKDGQFHLTATRAIFSAGRNVYTPSSVDVIVPPSALDKKGKKITKEGLAALLKSGAVLQVSQRDGNIVQKSRDLTVKDSVKMYFDLTAVLTAEQEAEWFAANLLKDSLKTL
jgi:hypothetical protein